MEKKKTEECTTADGASCSADECRQSSGGSNKETEGKQTLPLVTFSTFVFSIASSALVQLGEMPDPMTGKEGTNLDAAKHTIDILTMLQEKTVSNLDADEQQLLEGILYELRMKFVAKK